MSTSTPVTSTPNAPLLEVNDLKTYFRTEDGLVRAVDGVTFHIMPGETLGVVGESGSGKSVASLSVLRLIPSPPGRIVGGSVTFRGQDLLAKSAEEIRAIRGNEISMVFQEPMTSLNPVLTCGSQIAEAIMLHQKVGPKEARDKTIDMLRRVGIPLPERRFDEYPHQLSGGMRQRVMIAMALSCNPKLLIADEPTTALDVTIQAQILELMDELKAEFGMSILLITHDLGVIAEMAQRVVVMYGGQVVEQALAVPLFRRPLHPYTEGLLRSVPRLDRGRGEERERLYSIQGVVPNMINVPPGCRFNARCPVAIDRCREEMPPLVDIEGGRRQVRCWLRAGGDAK